MDIHYWRYHLTPKRRLNAIAADLPREGALIRVSGGYADVHPWPELGDAPIDDQLAMLARGETTALTAASLRFAQIDAEARRAGRSVFEGLSIPPSHWLFSDGGVPRGFDTVKVKLGPESDVDELRVLAGYRLRLDFNGTLEPREFTRFMSRIPPDVAESIDYVEDPCPYDGATWRSFRERFGVRLALDRRVAGDGVDVLVVKPAVQEMPAADGRPIVVTAYMDHPLGQFAAAWVAARHRDRVDRCGLLTHVVYEPDGFIERIENNGPELLPPAGTGFGFDDLLEKIPWKALG